MDIAADLDGSLELKKDRLRNKDLASFGAEIANLSLQQLNLLARAATSNLEEPVEYRVEIDFVLNCHLEGLSQRKPTVERKGRRAVEVVTSRSRTRRRQSTNWRDKVVNEIKTVNDSLRKVK